LGLHAETKTSSKGKEISGFIININILDKILSETLGENRRKLAKVGRRLAKIGGAWRRLVRLGWNWRELAKIGENWQGVVKPWSAAT
jgi:hypothetical protein